jgi:enoyl-CoA hydratase
MPDQAEGISVSEASDLIHLRLSRPPVNAFTVEMFGALTAALLKLADDPRPVLLSGSPRVFSAGFDIKAPSTGPVSADSAARACIAALRDHPGPTVAAVEGAAVGVGLLLAMSVDLLVVARNARLSMPEIVLGLAADVDPLRRFIAEPWIRRMCLLGEAFTPEALCLDAAGSMVCEPGTAQERGMELGRALGRLRPDCLRDVKRQFIR